MSRSRYVAGLRAVEQLLDGGADDIVRLHVEYRSANPRVRAITSAARNHGVELSSANRARLAQMSGDARHQGVVAEIRRSASIDEAALRTLVEKRLSADGDDKSPPLLILLLDGVQDPHNLGACMRTAEAAGADAIVVPRRRSADLGPTVSKVAAGAAERLTFARVPDLAKVLVWLGEYGVLRVGAAGGTPDELYALDLSGPLALVMGAEHDGLTRKVRERCDRLASLPMLGEVSSLNVSVAAGVCLYEAGRQRRAAAG